jgi:hypothetical protein
VNVVAEGVADIEMLKNPCTTEDDGWLPKLYFYPREVGGIPIVDQHSAHNRDN